MARYSFLMTTLLLLILNTTQGYSTELNYTKYAFLSTMQGIKNVLECYSSNTQESLHIQRENSGSLNTISDMVLQLKEQIAQQNLNIESIKKESTVLQKIDEITQENHDLRTMLEAKDTTVKGLEEKLSAFLQQLDIHSDNEQQLNSTVNKLKKANEEMNHKFADCEKKVHYLEEDVDAKNKTIEESSQKVQDLDKRLQESLQRAHELEAAMQKLNQTVQTRNDEIEQSSVCRQTQLQAMKKPVDQFNRNKHLIGLQTNLASAMDHGSEAYRQLQSIARDGYFMWNLGESGYTELASLLMCAGIHVDTADDKNYIMLHGAAGGGSTRMVKLLLDHGAAVDKTGNFQYTPLMWAAYYDHPDAVKMLVQAGASTTAKDNTGLTPLGIARFYGKTAVADYLQQFPH